MNMLNYCIEELLRVLDEQARLLRRSLGYLDRLRSALIKRDPDELGLLLDTIQGQAAEFGRSERARSSIQKRLAPVLKCRPADVSLTAICGIVPADQAERLGDRQKELRELTEKLRLEHACTNMLLRECARLNSALLKGILGACRENVTYNSRGGVFRQQQNDMVNLKL